MAESTAVLVPISVTDTQSNIGSGAYTDVDSTVDSPDGAFIISVADAWTGGVGTASAFSFTLTDLPAAAENIISVQLRARARINNSVNDIDIIVCDISGTNAPTETIYFSKANAATITTRTTAEITTVATVANINGWSVRVYQSGFTQVGQGADGQTFSLDEIDVVVKYGGTASAGEPTEFTKKRAQKITNHPVMARKPETQEQWNMFLQELNKTFRNEINGFEPVLTGFSANPTSPFCWYQRYGQLVYLEFAFGLGTSDSINFTITNLPDVIVPHANVRCLVNGLMQDNSSDLGLGSSAFVSSGGSITFYPLANTNGSWTASNNKGFSMPSDHYANITYFLRHPDKA